MATMTRTPVASAYKSLEGSKPKAPVRAWFWAGVVFLSIEVIALTGWFVSGDATRTDAGPTPLPDWMRIVLETWQFIGLPLALLTLYLGCIRPWRRTGHLTPHRHVRDRHIHDLLAGHDPGLPGDRLHLQRPPLQPRRLELQHHRLGLTEREPRRRAVVVDVAGLRLPRRALGAHRHMDHAQGQGPLAPNHPRQALHARLHRRTMVEKGADTCGSSPSSRPPSGSSRSSAR